MPTMTYREAIRDTLRREMRRNGDVVLMGEDIGAYGGSYAVTKGLLEEFGHARVLDTPIVEGTVVGIATGAAIAGLRPVAELMTINFALKAIDQIVNHAAKIRFMFGDRFGAPVVIRTVSGFGQLGPTHSQSFENYFAYVPGLIVATPATPSDAKGLLLSALRGKDPVLFVEHSLLYSSSGEVLEGEQPIPFGQSIVRREGSDVTVVAYSRMVSLALAAAEALSGEGVDAEVIDLRTLRPLDLSLAVRSLQKTGRVLVLSEGWPCCDISAEVCARLQSEAFDFLDAPILRLTSKDVPNAYAKNLEDATVPRLDDVRRALKQLCS